MLDKAQWLHRYPTGTLITSALVRDNVEVRDFGETAITIGRHTQQGTYQGRPADGQFRGPHVRVRDGGHWTSTDPADARIPNGCAGSAKPRWPTARRAGHGPVGRATCTRWVPARSRSGAFCGAVRGCRCAVIQLFEAAWYRHVRAAARS